MTVLDVPVAQGFAAAEAAVGGPSSGDNSTVLAKVRLILGAFLGGETELGLSDLTQRTGLKKATVFRLASGMVETGLLEKRDGRFRLSVLMFELGTKVRAQQSLRMIATPFLRGLGAACQETAHLSSLRLPMVVCIDRLVGADAPSTRWVTGEQMPMHSTAAGKSMLAFLPEAVLEEHFGRAPLPKMTDNTITSPRSLLSSLEEVRRTRVAYDREENWHGCSSVAAAIFGPRQNVIGALSISGPSSRINLESSAGAVLRAAAGITRRASTCTDLH